MYRVSMIHHSFPDTRWFSYIPNFLNLYVEQVCMYVCMHEFQACQLN